MSNITRTLGYLRRIGIKVNMHELVSDARVDRLLTLSLGILASIERMHTYRSMDN